MGQRDDFAMDVKDLLAKRVGMRCSKPHCGQVTCGPQEDPNKALNVGVAAHIAAASEGGPRYDPSMTPEERSSPENGIWLCQTHAKLVDNDPLHYPSELLHEWKRLAEQAALLDVERPGSGSNALEDDVALVRFYAQAFDRPAFQDPFMQEGSMEAFDRAVEDTITALNTGCLRARDGQVLARGKGKAFLRNDQWRRRMDTVVDMLRAVRARYALAIERDEIEVGRPRDGREWYCIRNPALAHWMDGTRAELLGVFTEVCEEAGVPAPGFPRFFPRSW